MNAIADFKPALEQTRIKVLCVDDEANVLASMAPHLRRRCDMLGAISGDAGLEVLRANRDVVVIISDMRMPGMDGASFLAKAREVAPDATRLVLTGQTDLASAIRAVNEGRIFRFLTKPCSPVDLLAAIEAAAEMHRLVTAERVLLEQTLHGSIKTLSDVLALTNPLAFGRAARLKQNVSEIADRLALRERWQVEVASMLSQLPGIALDEATAAKIYHGQPLDEADRRAYASACAMAEGLLANIPRLELVREMLARLWGTGTGGPIPLIAQRALVDQGVAMLQVAQDFDLLEARGASVSEALATLRAQPGRYRAEVLDALCAIRGDAGAAAEIRECPLGSVRPGMVFVEDVKLSTGALLVPRGYEVTQSLIERVRMLRPGAVKGLVRVRVKA
ncbi:MAG TPA: response regulator [Nevskiaceae bacterium]|nr:response regulator [Nevskiaceae bacterium]